MSCIQIIIISFKAFCVCVFKGGRLYFLQNLNIPCLLGSNSPNDLLGMKIRWKFSTVKIPNVLKRFINILGSSLLGKQISLKLPNNLLLKYYGFSLLMSVPFHFSLSLLSALLLALLLTCPEVVVTGFFFFCFWKFWYLKLVNKDLVLLSYC